MAPSQDLAPKPLELEIAVNCDQHAENSLFSLSMGHVEESAWGQSACSNMGVLDQEPFWYRKMRRSDDAKEISSDVEAGFSADRGLDGFTRLSIMGAKTVNDT